MIQKIQVLLYILIGFPILVIGQNLVNNPSMEEYANCPDEMGTVEEDVTFWTKSSNGTSDYFNKCSTTMGVPSNFIGSQTADFGNAYAGFYLYAPNNYREYLQVELTETLVRGMEYEVSFYISLAEKSKYAIKDIGLLFSKYRIKQDTRKVLSKFLDRNRKNAYNFSEIKNRNYYIDKSEWTLIKTTIRAKGDENYLSIGNFKDDSGTKVEWVSGPKKAAYYYLDMVSVTPLGKYRSYEDLALNKTYVMDNVLFPTDVWKLDEKAKLELRKLYKELQTDASLYISVHAHTDDEGTPDYNKNLSAKRARSVAMYLISLGLEKKRIKWTGHGGRKPIAKNSTEEGKKKNRRAEFIVSDKRFRDRNSMAETIFEDDN